MQILCFLEVSMQKWAVTHMHSEEYLNYKEI